MELLRVAVKGKAAGWQTLRRLTATEQRLDPQLLDDLLERARRQQDVVEGWRTRQAAAVFQKR
ncbi:hypothetical protein ACF05W_31175 [Streptomyces lydicus]|uniref:hypothetical protein n=1 Tax=Streptomyces lydicus TaxID=47763 RepID=UPI0036FE3166